MIQAVFERYHKTYLQPANKHNFAREAYQYPRTRECLQLNMNSSIASGYRERNNRERERIEMYPLADLSANKWRYVRCQIETPADKDPKYWVFVKYSRLVGVQFLSIDIDRHHAPKQSMEAHAQIEENFWQQVKDIEDSGLEGFWTTTPGCMIDGHHYYGLNFNILFDRRICVSTLQKQMDKLRDFLGWQHLSTQVDKAAEYTRNYRFPGQRDIQFCHVDSDLQTIQPKNLSFPDFLREWDKHPTMSWELLLEMIEAPPNPVAPITSAAQIEALAPATSDARLSRVEDSSNEYVDHLQSVHNTFDVHVKLDKTFSRYTHSVQADPDKFNATVEAIKPRLCRVRPNDSKTCGCPQLLDRYTKAKLGWFFRHFDKSKSIPRWRLDKDKEDKSRVQYFIHLPLKKIIQHLPYSCRHQFARLFALMQKYDGRISSKLIYGPTGIMSKPEWPSLLKKLSGVLIVLDEYSVEDHKCRQYGLAKRFVKLINGGRRKKEEIVVVTHPTSSAPDLPSCPHLAYALDTSSPFEARSNKKRRIA